MCDEIRSRAETTEILESLLAELKASKDHVRSQNTTRKGRYPTSHYKGQDGYSNYVRKPVRDLLKMADVVEEIVKILIEDVFFV